jgi:hypothetical protein
MTKGITRCVEMCKKDVARPAGKCHGAVLIGKNGRVLESGYNHYRTRCAAFHHGSPCSFHAEMDVLFRYTQRMKCVEGAKPS